MGLLAYPGRNAAGGFAVRLIQINVMRGHAGAGSARNQPARKPMKRSLMSLAMIAAVGTAAPALAQSRGDMTLGFGLGVVAPKSNNGTLTAGPLSIGNSARPTITFEYFIRDNLGIEVLAATPFKHDLKVGGAKIGSTQHLPPTLSLNWHFPMGGAVKPFVGLGVNYTKFFEEKSPLGSVKIGDSWGLAAQVGLDYAVSEKSALRMNLRWIDINADVSLNGTRIGKAQVDPLVFGLAYVMTF